jgi:anti-anti-sigma factor
MNNLFQIPRSPQGGVTVLTAPDEIDILNADYLFYSLMSAARSSSVVVVDMMATSFCDSTGFQRMILAGDHLRANGGDLRVACSARMHMLMRITHDDEHLSVFSGMSEALCPPGCSAPEFAPAA